MLHIYVFYYTRNPGFLRTGSRAAFVIMPIDYTACPLPGGTPHGNTVHCRAVLACPDLGSPFLETVLFCHHSCF